MPSPRPSMAIWKRLLLAIGVLIIVAASIVGYNVYQLVHTKIPESYAAWTTGNLMVEYLQTHTNKWPRSWEDLRSATNSLVQNRGMPVYMNLSRLQECVKIDWQTDPNQLLQSAQADSNFTAQVVTRLDGSKLFAAWGDDTEPNEKIIRYLETTTAKSGGAFAPKATTP